MRRLGVVLVLSLLASSAMAGVDDEGGDATPAALRPDSEKGRWKPSLDWYEAWHHAVRIDIAPGRFEEEDLGAGGLALQWEWWPTPHLAYTARTFMQNIETLPDLDNRPIARRQASGMAMGIQVATPGPVKLVGGAGAGVAFVNGRLPPSDRWAVRATPMSGVVEAHGGVVLMVRPVTLHALAWVHLYTEGPPVFSLSFGAGPVMDPAPPPEDDGIRGGWSRQAH